MMDLYGKFWETVVAVSFAWITGSNKFNLLMILL